MTFKVGDVVTWDSQADGRWRDKTGTVEQVIAPGTRPKGKGWGLGRDHESHVVRVRKGKRSKAYWPRVAYLIPTVRQ